MNLMCSNKTIKYLMFVFNFIFVITGIIMLGVGVSVKAYYYPYEPFLDDKYFSLPNMLIATGAFIFMISFLGCYGAIRENWLMLMAFSILLAIIFIFELSVGIAGYVLRDKTSSYLDTKLHETMVKYNSSPAFQNMWDSIQEEFQCCGVTNSSDWQPIFGSYNLPISCCPTVSGSVGAFYCNAYPTTEPTTAPTEATEAPVVTEPDSTKLDSNKTLVQNPLPSGEANNTSVDTAPINSASLVKDETETTTAYPPSTSNPYTTGCEAAFGNFLRAHAVDIGGVGIALAVIQLFGIFFSFHLARQLKNGYYST